MDNKLILLAVGTAGTDALTVAGLRKGKIAVIMSQHRRWERGWTSA